MWRAAVICIAAAALAVAVACGESLGDDTVAEEDAGGGDAANDVAAFGDAAVDADAGASRFCMADAHTFCEDFDDATDAAPGSAPTLTRWTGTGISHMTLVHDDAVSAPWALRVSGTAAEMNTEEFGLNADLPIPARAVTCSVNVRILRGQTPAFGILPLDVTVRSSASGVTRLSALVFVDANFYELGVYTESSDGGSDYVYAYIDDAGPSPHALRAAKTTLRIDRMNKELTFSIEERIVGRMSIANVLPPVVDSARVRITGSNGDGYPSDGGGLDLRFDDIVCDVE